MLDAFKQLVESGVMSEQVKSEIENAFNQKIQENRDQVTANLREEFAQKYAHDKGVMVEALDKMVSERLAAEMAELVTDKKSLAETKLAYKSKMTSDAQVLESFVIKQLGKELGEFQGDRQKVAENFSKLEQFIVTALAKEIREFAEKHSGKNYSQGCDFETNIRDITFDFSHGEVNDFIKAVKEKYPDVVIKTPTQYSKN